MKKDRFDRFVDFNFLPYSQVDNIPKIAILMDNTLFNLRQKKIKNSHSLEKEIISVLGCLATLILFGGMQLYFSINIGKTIVKSMKVNKTTILKSNKNLSEASSNNFNHVISNQELKIMIIKNAISHGKF